jgi:hypothetical protein
MESPPPQDDDVAMEYELDEAEQIQGKLATD